VIAAERAQFRRHLVRVLHLCSQRSEPLGAASRAIHDRALNSVLLDLRDNLDRVVAEAYGWPVDISTEDVLFRLVELNATRAAEGRSGVIRWLRPEFQYVSATPSRPRCLSVLASYGNFLRQTPALAAPRDRGAELCVSAVTGGVWPFCKHRSRWDRRSSVERTTGSERDRALISTENDRSWIRRFSGPEVELRIFADA
jgi:hypothetical protein